MAIKLFDIVLSSEKDNFYNSGGTLQGKIILVFSSGTKENIKKLRISFSGKARNYWQEENQDGELIEIQFEEQYLSFDADIAIDENHLSVNQESRTEYGFQYELSKGLPSSFEGIYGSIFYEIIATLEGTCCHTVTKEFSVRNKTDLNLYPELGQSSSIKSHQELLFGDGHLGIEGKILKVGFIPGENVNIELKLFNESNKEVRSNAFLLQETSYYAKDRKVSDTTVVRSVQGPKIEPKSEKFWNGNLLQIPEVPFSTLNGCSIIDLQYRLVIELEVPGRNINLEATIPIVIGSIPIAKMNDEITSPPLNSQNNIILDPDEKKLLNKELTSKKIRPRQSRSRTTCLVFRPERPKLKLPTPNPDSWPKPNKGKVNMVGYFPPTLLEDINPNDLTRTIEELVLSTEANNQGEGIDQPKPKWPAAFIRRRQKNSPKTPANLVECHTDPTLTPELPKHPVRKDLPAFPGYTIKEDTDPTYKSAVEEIVSGESAVEEIVPDTSSPILEGGKEVCPYPLDEYGGNFPLPNFSFNIQENGKCQREIGWNVKRNTLSIRRAKVACGFCLPLPTVGWSADP